MIHHLVRVSSDSFVATFVFTDIEGSTRWWEREPDRMRRALARHDALSHASVQAHRGRLVKRTGDGIHAVFDEPLDAVLAVLELQQALADASAQDPGALALAVSVVPIGSVLYGGDGPPDSTELELSGLVRMFVVVLAVEVAALAGNYL